MTARPVVVWDIPTRLFHWLAALLVAAAYATERLNWMGWHALAGEALLALVLFRIGWGVLGSDTARFARFLAPPRAAMQHLAHLFRREPDTQIGHNAAGGWMVLLMLGLMLGEAVSGILVNNDVADDGPLTEALPAWALNTISDLHEWLWEALLAAVALHLVAIATYALAKRQDLVRPMITGRKTLLAAAPRRGSLLLAAVLLAASAVVAVLAADWL